MRAGVWCVVCLSVLMVLPQIAGAIPEYPEFRHLGREQGLSQSTGNTFLQDHQGYMWIGTRNGLNLYNGRDITVFRHDPLDTNSISGNNISVLYEDSQGVLWVGTSGNGLNRFDRDTRTFTSYQTDYVDHGASISDNTVTAILEDSREELWIGTTDALNFLDPEEDRFVHFYAVDDVPTTPTHSHITSLFEDSRERLWVGTQYGLNYWDFKEGAFHSIMHDPDDPHSISHDHVTVIYEDSRGSLWIGTDGGGLNQYEPETGRFHHFTTGDDPGSISDNVISSILEDSGGNLWVGTDNGGLNLLDRENKTFRTFVADAENPHSLSNNAVYALYESDNQMLWVGTELGGINLLDLKPSNFEHYVRRPYQEHTLSDNAVLSFLEDRNGRFYVGTGGGGLNVFDRETQYFYQDLFQTEYADENLSGNVVLSLLEDQYGHIWTGYYADGLSRYDPVTGSVTHYRYNPDDPHTLASDHVYAIHEDRDGVIWIGTNHGGVNKYDRANDRFIRLKEFADGDDATRAIFHDSRGHLWVGSYGGGLRSIDRESHEMEHHFYHGDHGLNSHVVIVLYEDSRDNLWIGTVGGGLHYLDRDEMQFHSYSFADGLPTLDIYGILEDNSGHLWLSTDNGLVRFDPDQETFLRFGPEHGIQDLEFIMRSYYRDRDGYMYFGGVNGFNRFHPDSLRTQYKVPPVVFTDFMINNLPITTGGDSPLQKHVSQADRIVLDYDRSVLTFEFTALNYNLFEPNEYAYILEGFDTNWHFVGDNRSATYTNLRPGEYTFRVRTGNISGVWSDQAASIDLVVVPPFWRTTWFYLVMLLLLTGMIGLTVQLRLRSVNRRNLMLEEEVAKRTSELHRSNQELKSALEQLKKTRSQLVEKAHKAGMADLATGVLHDLGNILNSMTTSVNMSDEVLKKTQVLNFKKANKLLRDNIDNLEHFILKDPKGKILLDYYLGLEKPFENEVDKLVKYNRRLTEKIRLINDVVDAQQQFAKIGGVVEELTLNGFVEETLKLQSGNLDKEGVTVKTRLEEVDRISAERSKLVHALINLLINAVESMDNLPAGQKVISVDLYQDDRQIYLEVSDRGKGLTGNEVTKVFSHGYTTKKNGFGFGLHSASNYVRQMGGTIKAHSKGRDQGATFTMIFPRENGKQETERSH